MLAGGEEGEPKQDAEGEGCHVALCSGASGASPWGVSTADGGRGKDVAAQVLAQSISQAQQQAQAQAQAQAQERMQLQPERAAWRQFRRCFRQLLFQCRAVVNGAVTSEQLAEGGDLHWVTGERDR